MNPKNKIWKLAFVLVLIALTLSLPASAGRPSPSSGTLEAFFNLSTVADNHTIISAPQEGSETAGGLVGYWRFNNDSTVGEDYLHEVEISRAERANNATNASPVYDYSGEGNNGTKNHGTKE